MYTVMRKGYMGLDDDMCSDGEYEYMKTKSEANRLAKRLTRSYGEGCYSMHPWKGSTFYVQEVSNRYIRFVQSKGLVKY